MYSFVVELFSDVTVALMKYHSYSIICVTTFELMHRVDEVRILSYCLILYAYLFYLKCSFFLFVHNFLLNHSSFSYLNLFRVSLCLMLYYVSYIAIVCWLLSIMSRISSLIRSIFILVEFSLRWSRSRMPLKLILMCLTSNFHSRLFHCITLLQKRIIKIPAVLQFGRCLEPLQRP